MAARTNQTALQCKKPDCHKWARLGLRQLRWIYRAKDLERVDRIQCKVLSKWKLGLAIGNYCRLAPIEMYEKWQASIVAHINWIINVKKKKTNRKAMWTVKVVVTLEKMHFRFNCWQVPPIQSIAIRDASWDSSDGRCTRTQNQNGKSTWFDGARK